MSKKSISASLDDFFSDLRLSMGLPISNTMTCSQQAFSKARAGINHKIFKECFERVLDFLCSPDSHEYHKRFLGVWRLQFIASVAYDVLNQRIIDAQFDIMSVDERTLAIRHIESIISKSWANPLYTIFVFDRGYASKKLISYE